MTTKTELVGRLLRRAEIRLLNAAWEGGATSEYVRRTLSETASLCREAAAALTEAGAGEACVCAPNKRHLWHVPTDQHSPVCAWCGASPPPVQPVVKPVKPVQAALRAYAEASRGTRCPICDGIEGCDHTVKERLRAALQPAEQPDDLRAEVERLRSENGG